MSGQTPGKPPKADRKKAEQDEATKDIDININININVSVNKPEKLKS